MTVQVSGRCGAIPDNVGRSDPAAEFLLGPDRQDKAANQSVWHDLLRMVPEALTIQDAHGHFLFVNDAARELHEFVPHEQPAKNRCSSLNRRHNLAKELVGTGSTAVEEETWRVKGADRIFRSTHRSLTLQGEQVLMSVSIDITDDKTYEERLIRKAFYDDLTGLPMRRVTEQHIEALLDSRPEQFAIAFLDIDDFKLINDHWGHATGDRLLVEFARRVSRGLRGSDVLCRTGGDEFLLLINPVHCRTELTDFINHLAGRLKDPYFLSGSELFASASIGVSVFPEHGVSIDSLCRSSDIAMYRAKKGQKGTATFYDCYMKEAENTRLSQERALRLAVLERRFRCAYQPKFDIRTNEVTGIEALARLIDEDGVIQPPATFIDLAGELGLIDEITFLVLADVAASIDTINEEFGSLVSISMNVTAIQAQNVAFMRQLVKTVAETGFAKRFIVEITEDAFVSRGALQTEVLPLLAAAGVRTSIDDFGTGYSSLSSLAEIVADEIKIDRSFITDIHKRPRSQGILRAIESLSEALEMQVVAEGVETFEEVAYLQTATRIRTAQGFYFSKPILLSGKSETRTSRAKDERREPIGRPASASRLVRARSG